MPSACSIYYRYGNTSVAVIDAGNRRRVGTAAYNFVSAAPRLSVPGAGWVVSLYQHWLDEDTLPCPEVRAPQP